MFNKEIRSKIRVPNAEIDSFYEENKASFNVPETRFHVAQIVVTPAGDVPVANLRNDKAQGEEQARQKAERIAASLSAGEISPAWPRVFRGHQYRPQQRRPGFIPASALEKTDPQLRQAIFSLQPGQISGVVRTRDAYYILKLLDRQAPASANSSDPEVQQSIRKALANAKVKCCARPTWKSRATNRRW